VSLLKDRAVFLQDFVNDSRIFFFPPNNYDSSVASKKWTGEIAEFFEEFARLIPAIEDFSGVKMKELLSAKAAEKGMKIGALMQPLRLAITGEGAGPDLTEIISILGKVETEKRILKAVEAISV
jgi:glutamyl-tRNA synthetase